MNIIVLHQQASVDSLHPSIIYTHHHKLDILLGLVTLTLYGLLHISGILGQDYSSAPKSP